MRVFAVTGRLDDNATSGGARSELRSEETETTTSTKVATELSDRLTSPQCISPVHDQRVHRRLPACVLTVDDRKCGRLSSASGLAKVCPKVSVMCVRATRERERKMNEININMKRNSHFKAFGWI